MVYCTVGMMDSEIVSFNDSKRSPEKHSMYSLSDDNSSNAKGSNVDRDEKRFRVANQFQYDLKIRWSYCYC
jgi:hypothetical protein